MSEYFILARSEIKQTPIASESMAHAAAIVEVRKHGGFVVVVKVVAEYQADAHEVTV